MIDAQSSRSLAVRFLAMAIHAREQGDIVTAELLTANAMDYLDEANRSAAEKERTPRLPNR
jgi:hypothetical protein